MQIDYLREFLQLSESLNYHSAAEKLHMSQSSLSVHIAKLERELNVPLFSRSTTSTALTKAGSALVGFAQDIIAKHDETISFFNGFQKQRRLSIKKPYYREDIAMIFEFASEMGKTNPDILLEFEECDKREVFAAFRTRDIDAFVSGNLIGRLPEDIDAQSQAFFLRKAPIFARIPTDLPIARKKALSFEDIEAFPLAIPAGKNLRTMEVSTSALFEKYGVHPTVQYVSAENPEEFHLSLLTSNAICITSEPLPEIDGYVVRKLSGEYTNDMHIYVRRDSERPELAAFARAIRKRLGSKAD